jgi:hypothetical protein
MAGNGVTARFAAIAQSAFCASKEREHAARSLEHRSNGLQRKDTHRAVEIGYRIRVTKSSWRHIDGLFMQPMQKALRR